MCAIWSELVPDYAYTQSVGIDALCRDGMQFVTLERLNDPFSACGARVRAIVRVRVNCARGCRALFRFVGTSPQTEKND